MEEPSEAARRVTLGVIGLGTMGGAMARHLRTTGFQVNGYDVLDAPLNELRLHGGVGCASPAEVAERSEVVILSLPSVAAFDQVMAELTQVQTTGSEVQVIVETSTLPVEVKKRGRRVLLAQSCEMLDCPISGTGAQMAAGDAVFYASGPDAPLAIARPALEACGRAVFELGEFGNGSRLKLVANLLVAVHNAAAGEALLLAERSGIDPAVALPALLAGAGASRVLEWRGPIMVKREYRPATMKVDVFQKDVDIITAFASSLSSPVPMFALAAQLNLAALASGFGDADTASVHVILERLAGQ